MRIAIASGKGGTGKTFVTVNLARSFGNPLLVLDCDVEEPNSNLFIHGDLISERRSTVLVPRVDESLCEGSKVCSEVCEFNAIAVIGGKPLIFEDLCHSCGACAMFCPNGAIGEIEHKIGKVTVRTSDNIRLVEGMLDVGKALAVPVIRDVQHFADDAKEEHVLIDSPPGTSCPMVWTVGDADLVILVAEPTSFGLHDLKLAVETVREIGIQFGVVINKDGLGDDRLERYCEKEGIEILARIPHDRRIAEVYAKGEQVIDVLPEYHELFTNLWNTITRKVHTAGGSDV
jgi:MinD superfamily P-loop ATPase